MQFQINFDPSIICEPSYIRSQISDLGIDFVELRVLERPAVLVVVIRNSDLSICELEGYINLIPGITVKYI